MWVYRNGPRVKTTMELPDWLLREVKSVAATEGCTIRSVIEEAVRRDLDRRRSTPAWAPRADLVVAGDGLSPQASEMPWAEIRELAARPLPDTEVKQ